MPLSSNMDAHVGLDIEMNRGGNMTIVGLTSGMAADVSGMIWEGDVLEAGYKRIVIARSLSRMNHALIVIRITTHHPENFPSASLSHAP